MKNGMKIAAWVAAGAMVAGCSSFSGTRAKKDEALNNRLAALEGQVTALNQRVEEMAGTEQPDAAGSEASAQQPAPARTARRFTVRETQRALASAGFYQGPVDGKAGPKTLRAIREFQQANGLKVDGIVGSSTRQALAKHLQEPQE